MSTQTNTIAEAMKKTKTEAIEKINSLLWSDAETDKLVTAALSGGLTPEEVEAIETKVTAAKAELKKLAAFDVENIIKANTKLKAAYDAASLTVTTAEEIQEAAAGEYDIANSELLKLQKAFSTAAQMVTTGKIPIEKAPPEVKSLLEYRKAANRTTFLLSEHSQLKVAKMKKEPILEYKENEYEKSHSEIDKNIYTTAKKAFDKIISDIARNEKEQKEIVIQAAKLKKMTILK